MTVQCMRCDGSGKFDRGYCFDCKGKGYTNRKSVPSKFLSFRIMVKFSNGSHNIAIIYADSKRKAISLIEREVLTKGWKADIIALDPLFC